VLGLSRLVPRKGFDVLIDAVAALDLTVQLAIGGAGRDAGRLERRAAARGITGRCTFLGRVPDADLPALYGCADVFAMLCRERWAGLEAEGFGIVFVEAAACGVPSVAGRSGGSHEAVVDGETGFVVDPHDAAGVRAALQRLLGDDELCTRLGRAARTRAVDELTYERLSSRLLPVTRGDLGALRPLRSA
jgi:phosphatidylinositol alpha-1,6-mannosyltransferase